ncbi:hypothetical protein QOM21_20785 [Streptomyces sp. Pv4-95]|uniref:hypothetical protein n=1 Tax=Streptomyces sp. Pv4-95 TaxID=3049543 RepID=UPI003891C1AC
MSSENLAQQAGDDKDILKPLDSHRPIVGLEATTADSTMPVAADGTVKPKDNHQPFGDPKN